MSFLATAVIGAGVIGAGASIYGANKAADAQTNAANASIAAQKDQFGQTKDALQPFINFGQGQTGNAAAFSNTSDPNSVLSKLLALTGAGPGGSTDMNAALANTPGYQFSLEQGNKAVTSGLAARGLAGPGGALAKGGANYAEGLAGTTWQSVVNALQNAYSSGSGSLQNMVNTGAGAASSLAGNSTAVGQGISNSLIGSGNAQAGAATATGNAIGGGASSVSSALLLKQLLGNNGAAGSGASAANGLYSTPAWSGFNVTGLG